MKSHSSVLSYALTASVIKVLLEVDETQYSDKIGTKQYNPMIP